MSEPRFGLDRHHLPGPEEQLRAVQVGLERDAVVADLPQLRQAEDLEAAAVGQDRAVPAHERDAGRPSSRMSSLPGPQVQVIGVPEDDLGADLAQVDRGHGLDRALGADRHEDRRLDRRRGSVVSRPRRAAGRGILTQQLKVTCHIQGHRPYPHP